MPGAASILLLRARERMPYRTILFLCLLMPVLAVAMAGCNAGEEAGGELPSVADLTASPTTTPTGTPAPPEGPESPEPPDNPTPTDTPPSPGVRTTTEAENLYCNPRLWEQNHPDLQDWQRKQVLPPFEEFWNLRYRSEHGITRFEQISPYVSGPYLERLQSYYGAAEEKRPYMYLLQPLSDIGAEVVLISVGGGDVRVNVVLESDSGFLFAERDYETGDLLGTEQRWPYRMWNFTLRCLDGRWVVEDSTVEDPMVEPLE